MHPLSVLMILLGIIEIGWGAMNIDKYFKTKDETKLFFGILWIGVGIVVIVVNATTPGPSPLSSLY